MSARVYVPISPLYYTYIMRYKSINRKFIVFTLATATCAGAAYAAPVRMQDIRKKVDDGKYNAALWDLENLRSDDPAVAKTRDWNELAGICRFEQGDYGPALKLLTAAKGKGSKDVDLYLGRIAFMNYDFPLAQKLYGAYGAAREKAGKPENPILERYDSQLLSAQNALTRVEKLTVIDSIAVPVESFLKAYRLPSSAGKLLNPEEMPMEGHRSGCMMAFTNEGGDFMMWGEPDPDGNIRLMESILLTDGTWQNPEAVSETLNEYGNPDYPFMMPDGTTLYFAANGDESIGGYDIFVASRDASTGEYLQPQNLGMPYNSPYDDFMLAIDEQNGVGWWATDRNLLDDKVTVYVFIPNDLRSNYNSDEENIIDLARLASFRDTWNEDEADNYRRRLSAVEKASNEKKKKADFHIPLPGGGMATTLDDLNDAQKAKARSYLSVMAEYESAREDLKTLRIQYAEDVSRSLGQEIATAEKESEKLLSRLKKARSDFYKTFSK